MERTVIFDSQDRLFHVVRVGTTYACGGIMGGLSLGFCHKLAKVEWDSNNLPATRKRFMALLAEQDYMVESIQDKILVVYNPVYDQSRQAVMAASNGQDHVTPHKAKPCQWERWQPHIF